MLVAVALPLRHKRIRLRKNQPRAFYRIDTDTTHANYAVNEFGFLEKINRVSPANQKPEMEN